MSCIIYNPVMQYFNNHETFHAKKNKEVGIYVKGFNILFIICTTKYNETFYGCAIVHVHKQSTIIDAVQHNKSEAF